MNCTYIAKAVLFAIYLPKKTHSAIQFLMYILAGNLSQNSPNFVSQIKQEIISVQFNNAVDHIFVMR